MRERRDCFGRTYKGLLEGLMLKRARCTIYMVQETDTMGKDSELATTLAQGKPVIAYVPKEPWDRYATKIADRPLEYFSKRILGLKEKDILDDDKCCTTLDEKVPKHRDINNKFMKEFEDYRRHTQPYRLWDEKDSQAFKNNRDYFLDLCRIVAIAEQRAFDKRAWVLSEAHPLSMQVDLQYGVANGVLVARSPEQCVGLLHSMLLNSFLATTRRCLPKRFRNSGNARMR